MSALTRPPSSAHRRRAPVERAVLDAVERLLEAGSTFTELSVQTIADEAGLARSTFYVHFVDKTDLLIRLGSAATDQLFAEIGTWFEGDHTDGETGLREALARVVAVYRSHAAVLGALLEAVGYEPIVRDFWRSKITRIVDAAVPRLQAAQATGELSDAVDAGVLMRILGWSLERTVYQHVAEHDSRDDPAFVAGLARACWLLLYGDSPRPPGNRPRRRSGPSA